MNSPTTTTTNNNNVVSVSINVFAVTRSELDNCNGETLLLPKSGMLTEALLLEDKRTQMFAQGDGGSATELPLAVATPVVANQRSKPMAQALTKLAAYKNAASVAGLSNVIDCVNPYVQQQEQQRAINHCVVTSLTAAGLETDELDFSSDAPTALLCIGDGMMSVSMFDKETGALVDQRTLMPSKMFLLCPADYVRFRYVLKPLTAGTQCVVMILRAVARTRTRAEVQALIELANARQKKKDKPLPRCEGGEDEEEAKEAVVASTKKRRLTKCIIEDDDADE